MHGSSIAQHISFCRIKLFQDKGVNPCSNMRDRGAKLGKIHGGLGGNPRFGSIFKRVHFLTFLRKAIKKVYIYAKRLKKDLLLDFYQGWGQVQLTKYSSTPSTPNIYQVQVLVKYSFF